MSTDSLPTSVKIQVLGLERKSDVASVSVFLHDQRQACGPPANLVGLAKITANSDENVIALDYSQAAPDKMIQPNLYVSLNVAESTVTYQTGSSPDFQILQNGGSGKLHVQPKE